MSTTTTPIATATSGADPIGLPDGSEGHRIWLFLSLLVELALLANLVLVTRYTVLHRSGLNEPDKIRRIWARASDIRYQPVSRPLLFAIGVSYGAQSVLHNLIRVALSVFGVGAGHMSLLGTIISLVSVGGSSAIAILVYRASGGENIKVCAGATLAFDWFMAGVLLNFARTHQSMFAFWILCLFYLLVLAVIQVPCYIWGAYRQMPPTSRLIYNSTVVPNWVRIDRTIAMVSVPLALVYLIAYMCETAARPHMYFGNIVYSLAGLMVLSCAALASIISVNRALLSNEFQWQWRAFLTPSIPLGIVDFVLIFVKVILGKIGFFYGLWFVIHFFFTCGSCGVLGAYVYLKWAELYAQHHIDDDVLAQSDLLEEFEEDEDNEEINV